MEELLSNLPESCKTLLEQTKGSFVQGLQNAPGYKEPGWKGYRYSMHFSSDATQKIYEECDFPENSVILASFPKTGQCKGINREVFCMFHIKREFTNIIRYQLDIRNYLRNVIRIR